MCQKKLRSRGTLFHVLCSLILATLLPHESSISQGTEGRWVFGLRGGSNLWFNDYNRRVGGEGGDLTLRYGIAQAFSVGIVAGYEELKSNRNPPYYVKLRSIPASLIGWYHFAPDRLLDPFLYLGVGAFFFDRISQGAVQETQGKFKTSMDWPAGVGIESFPTEDLSINFDIGVGVIADYSDGLTYGHPNGFLTAKLGVNFYFGASALEEQKGTQSKAQLVQELMDAEARRIKELADAEALRMKARADSESQRTKDSIEASTRRSAALKPLHPIDTVVVHVEGENIALKGVTFKAGLVTLTKDAKSALRITLTTLLANPKVTVLIAGYSDNTGKEFTNKRISLRRAQVVRNWLLRRGIPLERLRVSGFGSADPIDDNSTPEGRANNRRVEFRVLK